MGLCGANCGHKADKEADMAQREEFLAHLREALNHLYHPERLRRTPLAALFGVANRMDTASALQQILVDAIQAMKPQPDEPAQSPAWQIYDTLFYRYVEQLTADEVADQLGITPRHLRRWQNVAQEALAERLWRQFGLQEELISDTPSPEDDAADGAQVDALRQELKRLHQAGEAPVADTCAVLAAVSSILEKLARLHHVDLATAVDPGLPPTGIAPVALRQILISLGSVVIPHASGGKVELTARTAGWEVEITLRCARYPTTPSPPIEGEATNLTLAQQIAHVAGCMLHLSADARGFDATLTIPAIEQIPILAIDDSEDTLQLLRRHLTNTRYRLVTAQTPQEGFQLAESCPPAAILLDVMMPHVDGWEMLGRFREHPRLAGIPIIVCTILPQHDLAMLLGASAFLKKPFTRSQLLGLLDQQVQLPKRSAPASHGE
ncbi:MAG: hypothetical protein Kow0047_17380 [Anaerolineae bacterium]